MKRAKPDIEKAFALWEFAFSFLPKKEPREFFNRDASLEIDRLTVENEELKERLAKHEPVSR